MAEGAISLALYPPNADEPKDFGYDDDIAVEEGERLLSATQNHALPSSRETRPVSSTRSRRTIATSASRRSRIMGGLFFVFSVFVFLVIPAFLPQTSHHYTGMPVAHDVRLSNGTHQFRKTVLMVSIDGLRADYIDRGLTPHLLDISRKGLRAKFMKSVFPTLTFPNHWSLMTGLYAESHGIVANNFYDPVSKSPFHYSDPTIHYNSSWWGGTPIWETVSKAGLITANLMWPGPVKTRNGISPTYFVPWQNHVPLQEKHDKIMEWIDLPFDIRPQLILAYEPHLDQVGHKAGPNSDLVNNVLLEVDKFAASIHASLRERHLENIVDVIFVSDHGMADTSNTRLIYLDDVMGTDHVAEIEYEDGWPSVGLRMSPRANTTEVLAHLLSSGPATSDPPAMHVYTAETMPERYHFNPSNNERIAPIYIVPRLGWAITNHHEHEVVMQGDYKPKGNHGYDNDEPSMHAAFVADGPFATLLKHRRRERSSFFLRSLPARVRRHVAPWWIPGADVDSPRRRGEPQIIEGFENVEVYGLIVKLLGIEPRFAAATNGTVGFWERYLDDDA